MWWNNKQSFDGISWWGSHMITCWWPQATSHYTPYNRRKTSSVVFFGRKAEKHLAFIENERIQKRKGRLRISVRSTGSKSSHQDLRSGYQPLPSDSCKVIRSRLISSRQSKISVSSKLWILDLHIMQLTSFDLLLVQKHSNNFLSNEALFNN